MTELGSLHDIPPGEGRAFAVDGEAVAVFRLRDGAIRAVQAVCPHRGGPLADGQIDLKQVVCPLHQNAWDLTTGRSLSGQPDLTTYPVRLDGDRIVLGD
jgi:nitrite reductase (NADH) small subunit